MGRTLIALAAVMLLAGCGGKPAADPPPKHHISTSVTPSPTPPAMTPAATEHTSAGAKAFVEYFFAVADDAQARADTTQLKKLISPQCTGCQGALAAIEDVAAKGGVSHGGGVTVSGASAKRLRFAHGYAEQVVFEITSSPQTITYPGNASTTAFPGGAMKLRFVLAPVDGGWIVDSWTSA